MLMRTYRERGYLTRGNKHIKSSKLGFKRKKERIVFDTSKEAFLEGIHLYDGKLYHSMNEAWTVIEKYKQEAVERGQDE